MWAYRTWLLNWHSVNVVVTATDQCRGRAHDGRRCQGQVGQVLLGQSCERRPWPGQQWEAGPAAAGCPRSCWQGNQLRCPKYACFIVTYYVLFLPCNLRCNFCGMWHRLVCNQYEYLSCDCCHRFKRNWNIMLTDLLNISNGLLIIHHLLFLYKWLSNVLIILICWFVCLAQRLGCALLLLPAAFKEPCASWFSVNKVSF